MGLLQIIIEEKCEQIIFVCYNRSEKYWISMRVLHMEVRNV